MLEILIPPTEEWNEVTNEFVPFKGQLLRLEHSLISLSKWESRHKKPFLAKNNKTDEESLDYIRCMAIDSVDLNVYRYLTKQQSDMISNYIGDPMTATTFSTENKGGLNKEIITSEVIYYWMIALTIPFECQKWHLNRLLTLINVCNLKNQPKKKMRSSDILARNASLNAARRAKLNTSG